MPAFYKNTDYLLPDKGLVNGMIFFIGLNDMSSLVQ